MRPPGHSHPTPAHPGASRGSEGLAPAVERHPEWISGMLESSPMPILLMDRDGRIARAGRAAERLHGFAEGDAAGRIPDEVLPAEQAETIRATDGRVLASGSPLEYEEQIATPDGDRTFLTVKFPLPGRDGRPAGTCAISTDITERRTAERRLREAERTYRTLVEELPVATYVDAVDRHSSAIYSSPQIEEMLGYPAQEWISDPELFEKVLHPEDRARVMDQVARTNRDGSRFSAEYRMLHRDGHVVWVRDESTCTLDDAGRPLWFQGFLEDITAHKESERERRELEARLAHADRLEGMGRLAGGIAHDFNNLLAVILTHAGFVAADLPEGSSASDDVDRIRGAAQRAADLVRHLLVFGRREPARAEPLDLSEVTRETKDLLQALVGPQVALRFDLAADLPPVMADRARIGQVLMNLVTNARDALGASGSVEIRTAMGDGASAGEVAGEEVVLSVSDAGEGMSEEIAAQAFEPFFTAKLPGEGTGLGLATVYGIATQAGGRVEVESSLGAGTTVTVRLPATAETKVPLASGDREEPRVDTGATVLLVEDEHDIRHAADRILTGGGYEVIAAGSADEALAVCARRSVDLVLTDIVMPGTSGTALAERVAELRPDAAVTFMTGYSDRRDAVGEADVLEKPFTAEQLLKVVAVAFGRSGRRGDRPRPLGAT